ncbi:beta-defensin 105A-like [Sorex fumeus]|uniref:beta-defensin 105A-like n=1 Tax=Sorex fumeus TaxID=62283 RepID=UPI0024ADB8C2|nr:beta-defensin 105A-like [Sorex fumeus]
MKLLLAVACYFLLAQLPAGCQAGFENNRLFLTGDFAPCEPCRLGRGKCRKECRENEIVMGNCKLSFFCCYPRFP